MFLQFTENYVVVGAIVITSSILLLVGVYQVSTDKSFTVPTIHCLFTHKAMYTNLGHNNMVFGCTKNTVSIPIG